MKRYRYSRLTSAHGLFYRYKNSSSQTRFVYINHGNHYQNLRFVSDRRFLKLKVYFCIKENESWRRET